MRLRDSIVTVLPSIVLVSAWFFATAFGAAEANLYTRDTLGVCKEISNAISAASEVFYPCKSINTLSLTSIELDLSNVVEWYYTEDVEHYMSSSSQDATCSVEPGNAQDVGIIVSPCVSLSAAGLRTYITSQATNTR